MPKNVTLYHYLHCPFCIRVRLALGYLQIPYDSVLLSYADEQTPIKLTGKKMAPILQKYDGSFINESIDIIDYLDSEKTFKLTSLKTNKNFQDALLWIDDVSKSLFNLLMPYYLNNIEFNDNDRKYFLSKKQIKRGSFKLLVEKRPQYINEVNSHLEKLYPKINTFYESENLTLSDILLASHLWGLYLAYDFRVDERLHLYLQNVSSQCHFKYDGDWWINA